MTQSTAELSGPRTSQGRSLPKPLSNTAADVVSLSTADCSASALQTEDSVRTRFTVGRAARICEACFDLTVPIVSDLQ